MAIRYLKSAAVTVSCFILVSSFMNSNENMEVPYPRGFRTWAHVKSAVILEDHPTIKKYGGYHL